MAFRGHRFGFVEHARVVERPSSRCGQLIGAVLEDRLGCALHEDLDTAVVRVECGHRAPTALEGKLRDARPTGLDLDLRIAGPMRRLREGNLGGLSGGPSLRPADVVADRHRPREQRPGRGRAVRFRKGAPPLAVGEEYLGRHAVLGERARLVGADGRHRAEGLDGRQPPDERVVAAQGAGAQRQGDGDDGGERLGDRCDREAHGGQEHQHGGLPLQQARGEHHGADCQGRQREVAPEARQPSLERRPDAGLASQELGDPPDLGRLAGRDDDTEPPPSTDQAALEGEIDALLNRGVDGVERSGRLLDAVRLAGQHRLVGEQLGRLHQAQIRGDDVAGLQHDQVSGHDHARLEGQPSAFAQHPSRGRRHGAQRGHRALGPELLHGAHHGVEQDDDHDREGVLGLSDYA